jgi:hypothetical protein
MGNGDLSLHGSLAQPRIDSPSHRVQLRHRKTESRFVISVQGSLAVRLCRRKKRAAVRLFHFARRTCRAPCLFATMRNLAASSRVGFAAAPPLTCMRIICKASPALNSTNRLTVVFADCQQIDYTDRLAAGLSAERYELPACPRCNLADAHLRHRHGPSGSKCSFLLRALPIHRLL